MERLSKTLELKIQTLRDEISLFLESSNSFQMKLKKYEGLAITPHQKIFGAMQLFFKRRFTGMFGK